MQNILTGSAVKLRRFDGVESDQAEARLYPLNEDMSRHFKELGGEQSLSELVVSFWLIPLAEEFLVCK